MPTYEFLCKVCNKAFEVTKSIKELEILSELGYDSIRCPICKSSKVRKQIAVPNVLYKGKGFTKAVKEPQNEFADSN